ncbi:MAG: hypothetical protein WKF80_05165 [Thermomicrobiales bacterium]
MSELMTRRRFTVAELDVMDAAGLFDRAGQIELIEGDIIEMPLASAPHSWCVTRFSKVVRIASGWMIWVSVHNPVQLGDHDMPRPDIAINQPLGRPTTASRTGRHPLSRRGFRPVARRRPNRQTAPLRRRGHPRGLDH